MRSLFIVEIIHRGILRAVIYELVKLTLNSLFYIVRTTYRWEDYHDMGYYTEAWHPICYSRRSDKYVLDVDNGRYISQQLDVLPIMGYVGH